MNEQLRLAVRRGDMAATAALLRVGANPKATTFTPSANVIQVLLDALHVGGPRPQRTTILDEADDPGIAQLLVANAASVPPSAVSRFVWMRMKMGGGVPVPYWLVGLWLSDRCLPASHTDVVELTGDWEFTRFQRFDHTSTCTGRFYLDHDELVLVPKLFQLHATPNRALPWRFRIDTSARRVIAPNGRAYLLDWHGDRGRFPRSAPGD